MIMAMQSICLLEMSGSFNKIASLDGNMAYSEHTFMASQILGYEL